MNLSYRNRNLLNLYYRLPKFAREIFAALYSLKVRNQRFGNAFHEQMRLLQANENLSREEKARRQVSDLKAALGYAYENVPYYRALFDQVGFRPDDLQSIADLGKVPLLERDIVRSKNAELHSTTFTGPKFSHRTSGTTGTALSFTLSEEANQRHYGCVWHHYGWAGMRRGDRLATFGGHPLIHPDRQKPPFWLYDAAENELYFSIQHISPENAPYYVDQLLRFKPAIVRGIPSFLNLIAQYMIDKGITYTPRGIFTYSETLLDRQRKALEQAFNCAVYNFYSNGERSGHVLQCRHGRLHVLAETSVIEIVRADGSPAAAGEVGELVITNMINRAMPLIRYRIGDTGVVSREQQCPCGRETPLLENLTGRMNDFLVTGDGRRIRPIGVFMGTPMVKAAQFVQEEAGFVVVKIVPREGFGLEDEKKIAEELDDELGSSTSYQIKIVDDLPFGANGKLQHIISSVPS
jgi:phenylacetate-CoA ligase